MRALYIIKELQNYIILKNLQKTTAILNDTFTYVRCLFKQISVSRLHRPSGFDAKPWDSAQTPCQPYLADVCLFLREIRRSQRYKKNIQICRMRRGYLFCAAKMPFSLNLENQQSTYIRNLNILIFTRVFT